MLAKTAIENDQYGATVKVLFPRLVLNVHFQKEERAWSDTDKGTDTFEVINKVSLDFICSSRVIQYYSEHGSFRMYLLRI